MDKIKYTIMISLNPETKTRIQEIAKIENKSMNSKFNELILKEISNYEKKFGPIELSQDELFSL